MVLTQAQRRQVYDVWARQLGDEVADAVLSQFPSSELDVPVTKEFVELKIAEVKTGIADVRAEIAYVRTELSGQIADLRTDQERLRGEVSGQIAEFRAEVSGQLGEFRAEQERLRGEMQAGFHQIRGEMHAETTRLVLWVAGVWISTAVCGVSAAIALS